ncbi:MAG: response regulator, partial [Prevotella sp.]|nr:response regulator [Prevotella sp.]
PDDSTSLFGNNIRTICGDKKGHLFLLCKSGALLFDLKTEKFTAIRKHDVQSIAYGQDNFWLTLNDSVFACFPAEEPLLKLHLLLPDKSLKATAILGTSDKLLYIATSTEGLLIYDKNLKIVNKLNISDIIYLYEDSKHSVWVCTRYSGLYKIDFRGNITAYRHDPLDAESIPDNFVRTICEDNTGNYWIGLFAGLCKLESEKKKFTAYRYEKYLSDGMSSSSVWSIINDRQGTLWIGTYFGGIDLYNPRYSIYNYYEAAGNKEGLLSSPVVGRIVETDKGNLWIGTEGGGLNYFDREKQTFTSYLSGKNSLSSNTIKSLWLDEKRNNLWIGTHMGGLNKLDLKTHTFSVFKHNPNNPKSIPNNYVRDIVQRNDTLYLSTRNSVGVFDLKTETCSTINFKDIDLSKKEFTDFLIDSQERMWFVYSNNAYSYNLTSKQLRKYKTRNNILVFYEDSRRRLWAGTDGDGIYLFDEKEQKFNSYPALDRHLSSMYIIDIKESQGGYFYISTNAGLFVIDTEFKNSQIFNSANGFPLEALNENSLYISSKNEVFAGGINGMVSFFEKDMNIPHADYDLNITDIWVNNKKLVPGKSSIIQYALPYLKEITLKSEHSVISISFSTTNYIHVLKSDIQYKLEGFDKDWIDANYQQSITYTNLNPGEYTLKLRGKNKTGNGLYPEKELVIIVLPPFYKTIWAYIVYAFLIIVTIAGLFRFYISKIKLRTSLEYEKRENRHIEELNQSKLRFFTNISHEFRTPLTLIVNQIEIILQAGNIPQAIYGRLLNVMRNANRMKKLITELIDFRKYEQGFMELKVSENNLIAFLNEIFLSFKELAQSREIYYTFEHKQVEMNVWFDQNQMEKVFYNLIDNAFKYTSAKGSIILRVEETEGFALISVIDNGVGIDKESLGLVFDRFYQADNHSPDWPMRQGSGIGLSLAKSIVTLHNGEIGVVSEPDKGSRFWVKLLLGDGHFKPEQKTYSPDRDTPFLSDPAVSDEKFIEEILLSQKTAGAANSTILIIEDNREVLALLSNIFQPIYKVITETDGMNGFEKAVEMQPDIILSDVMMPRMSGVDLCAKLKHNFETSHIPVILLTAQSASDYVIQGLLTGADDYIVKPFNTKILVTRCNNLVNSRKLLQKKFAMQPEVDSHMIATNSIDQRLLERATGIVERHIDNPNFDMNIFASEMCLSRTNLFNKIKGVTGQTPNDFILNMRLKKSIYYLMNEQGLSIADIAVQVGFTSSSYYIKKFHKLYGVTPAQYKIKNKK